MLTIRLDSGLKIEVDPMDWPEIGSAEWTSQQSGGVVTGRVIVRRHVDGRTIIYIDANPGEGPLVDGDLLAPQTKELEDAIARFGELHCLPDWVVAKCILSVRG
jgi:hypothetical protein